MKSKNETIADIVAEKRHRADEIERDVSAKMKSGEMVSDQYAREVIEDLRQEADRIEAAAKREVQNALDTGGYVEACRARKKLVDNGAKMREALEHIAAIPMPPPNEMAQGIAVEMREVAIAALAEPPRNCDIYPTVAEARNAFVCEKCDDPCGDCTVCDDDYALCHPCGIKWLFALAKEGGNDGK